MTNAFLDTRQLQALAAILHHGSFEGAAHSLGITQSAVSQRLRTLEEQVGTTLVVRGQPCSPTETGGRVAAHAEKIALLESDLRRELELEGAKPTLKIAVNADSLATWFLGACAGLEAQIELVVDDQEHSAELLRRGEVVAAVSADGDAVQGCDRISIGPMRYVPTASPGFVTKWFADGVTASAIRKAPVLIYNQKDGIQHAWASKHTGQSDLGPRNLIPSTTAFVEAAALGLGWGLNPEDLVKTALHDGSLVDLSGGVPFELPLFWQTARAVAPALAPLTHAIKARRNDLARGSTDQT